MKSFIEYLTEAPVTDYKTFGDFSKSHSFKKRDRAIITSPKSINNTKQKLGKTEHNLNLYFINSKEANRHTEIGVVSLNWVKQNLGDEIYNYISNKLEEDAINVIFTNNKGEQGVPMTPWIISHRIAHALSKNDYTRYGQTHAQFQEYREAGNSLREAFNDLIECYGIQTQTFSKHISDTNAQQYLNLNDRQKQLLFKQIGSQVCTFKSARDGKIREWFEILNELFAQYIVTGRIQFNLAPDRLKFGRGFLSLQDEETANDILNALSHTLHYWFDSLCNSAYGKILVM